MSRLGPAGLFFTPVSSLVLIYNPLSLAFRYDFTIGPILDLSSHAVPYHRWRPPPNAP